MTKFTHWIPTISEKKYALPRDAVMARRPNLKKYNLLGEDLSSYWTSAHSDSICVLISFSEDRHDWKELITVSMASAVAATAI